MDLKQHIRQMPDFPEPGITFCDISTLLAHPGAWQTTIEQLAEAIAPHRPAVLAAIESRGFLLAAPLAVKLDVGFCMVRKSGKLPGPTSALSYDLEYGSDSLEIQQDAVRPGQRVVVVDDLLATGGTLGAAIRLLKDAGAEVIAAAVVIELGFLGARERLDVPLVSLVTYDE